MTRVLFLAIASITFVGSVASAQSIDLAQCGEKAQEQPTTALKDAAYQACIDGRAFDPAEFAKRDPEPDPEKAEFCRDVAKHMRDEAHGFRVCMDNKAIVPPRRPKPRGPFSHFVDDFGINQVNSAGGVEPFAQIVNPDAGSPIKYVTLEMLLFNAVGDRVASSIGGRALGRLKFTGPLPSDEEGKRVVWGPIWYENSGHCVTITSVAVEFMNGRKASFTGKALTQALAPRLKNDCRVR